MKPGKKNGKYFSLTIVIVMIISLAAALLISAGAVNANMSVGSHSVVNNSPALASIDAGQVWTGKNVSETGSFGDGPNGQFTVTLSAIGGATGSSLIDTAGLTFDDTFTAEYAFVTTDSQMTFYIDGTAHTVALSGGVYQYAEGAGATLVEVTFSPAANTVKYFVGQNALRTVVPGSVSSTAAYNSLAFGVRLTDEVATAGTYNTNLTKSCTARFNTVQNRSEYVSRTNSTTYENKEDIYGWEKVPVNENYTHFKSGGKISGLEWIKLELDGGSTYEFSGEDIWYDETTQGEGLHRQWIVGIYAGTYFGDTLKLNEYVIRVNIFPNDEENPTQLFVENERVSGEVEIYTIITPGTQFEIVTPPTGDNTNAVVKAGGTTYTGTIGAIGTAPSPLWSFTDTSGAVVMLVDENTLTVTTTTGQTVATTQTIPVTDTHDDYGIVELGQVAGEVDKGVAGDSDVLPQTDGISNSTLLGVFGLALIAIGGTTFVIYRKKFLS